MTPAIALKDVTVRRGDAVLLDRVTWEVAEDERWIVLGPNGAGKTTLLEIVSGLIYPSRGKAYILGERLGRTDVRELRTRIGMTSAHLADRVPSAETAVDAVISAAYGVVGRWNEEYDHTDIARAEEILVELGLDGFSERTFGTLSEGERKRVLVARALMADPEILLLDEPAAGLDLGGREDLVSSLNILAEEPTSPVIILVSHHVEEIPRGFTHALLLRDGAVVAAGPIEETITADALSRTYGMRLYLTHEDGRYTARRASYGRRALGR